MLTGIDFEIVSDLDAWERHIFDVGRSLDEASLEKQAEDARRWLYDETERAIHAGLAEISLFTGNPPAAWLERLQHDVAQRDTEIDDLEDTEIDDLGGSLGIGGSFTTREVQADPPNSWYGSLWQGSYVTFACYGMLFVEVPPPVMLFAHWKLADIMKHVKAHERKRQAALSSARVVETTPAGIVVYGLASATRDTVRAALNLRSTQRRSRGAPIKLTKEQYLAAAKKYPGASAAVLAQKLRVSRTTIMRRKM